MKKAMRKRGFLVVIACAGAIALILSGLGTSSPAGARLVSEQEAAQVQGGEDTCGYAFGHVQGCGLWDWCWGVPPIQSCDTLEKFDVQEGYAPEVLHQENLDCDIACNEPCGVYDGSGDCP